MVGFGDHRTSSIVARIAEEEIAHVAVGVYWFNSICHKMNRAPCSTFKGLVAFCHFSAGSFVFKIHSGSPISYVEFL